MRSIHKHHHHEVIPMKGMMLTDLMAVHPLEYWVSMAPAYQACFALASCFPQPNMLAFTFGHYVALALFFENQSTMSS